MYAHMVINALSYTFFGYGFVAYNPFAFNRNLLYVYRT